jgi:hypothetical protein
MDELGSDDDGDHDAAGIDGKEWKAWYPACVLNRRRAAAHVTPPKSARSEGSIIEKVRQTMGSRSKEKCPGHEGRCITRSSNWGCREDISGNYIERTDLGGAQRK